MTRAQTIAENKRLARALVAVFWHRTRGCFVPLTRDEIVLRSGLTDVRVGPALWHLQESGWLVSRSVKFGRTNVPTYEMTSVGVASFSQAQQVAA